MIQGLNQLPPQTASVSTTINKDTNVDRSERTAQFDCTCSTPLEWKGKVDELLKFLSDDQLPANKKGEYTQALNTLIQKGASDPAIMSLMIATASKLRCCFPPDDPIQSTLEPGQVISEVLRRAADNPEDKNNQRAFQALKDSGAVELTQTVASAGTYMEAHPEAPGSAEAVRSLNRLAKDWGFNNLQDLHAFVAEAQPLYAQATERINIQMLAEKAKHTDSTDSKPVVTQASIEAMVQRAEDELKASKENSKSLATQVSQHISAVHTEELRREAVLSRDADSELLHATQSEKQYAQTGIPEHLLTASTQTRSLVSLSI